MHAAYSPLQTWPDQQVGCAPAPRVEPGPQHERSHLQRHQRGDDGADAHMRAQDARRLVHALPAPHAQAHARQRGREGHHPGTQPHPSDPGRLLQQAAQKGRTALKKTDPVSHMRSYKSSSVYHMPCCAASHGFYAADMQPPWPSSCTGAPDGAVDLEPERREAEGAGCDRVEVAAQARHTHADRDQHHPDQRHQDAVRLHPQDSCLLSQHHRTSPAPGTTSGCAGRHAPLTPWQLACTEQQPGSALLSGGAHPGNAQVRVGD